MNLSKVEVKFLIYPYELIWSWSKWSARKFLIYLYATMQFVLALRAGTLKPVKFEFAPFSKWNWTYVKSGNFDASSDLLHFQLWNLTYRKSGNFDAKLAPFLNCGTELIWRGNGWMLGARQVQIRSCSPTDGIIDLIHTHTHTHVHTHAHTHTHM